MDTPLSEFLNEEPQIEVAEEQAEVVETPVERERDEHGRFVSKTGEVTTATAEESVVEESVTPTPEAEPQNIPVAALRDERQKRQQLEERVRQYDAYFAQLQAQQPPQEEADMFADPDGFKAQLRAELIRELQPTLQQQGTLTRAEVSEMLARQKYEDYDAKIEVFKEAIQGNQFLLSQLHQAPDPATFAYNAANKYLEAKQYGTAGPSREAIEAEIREKIIAELGIRPKAPSTMAGDRSVGTRTGPEWAGPTPLGDILR